MIDRSKCVVHIGYYDGTNSDLKVAHCSNTDCSEAITSTKDREANDGFYTSVTVGVRGLEVTSYYDSDNADLKVSHCSNTECSEAITSTIDSEGNVRLYTSVTI